MLNKAVSAIALLCIFPFAARADDPPAKPDVNPVDVTAAPPAPSVEERLRALEEDNARLQENLKLLREDHDQTAARLEKLTSQVSGRISGYFDFGFFYVTGDGSGIRPDTGHAVFPQYSDVPDSWVFYGDPLATAINSRGDPADTSGSRAVTFDAIHNGGAPTFILNALNLNLFAGLTHHLTVNGMIDFVPRSRDVSIDADSGPMFGSTTKNPSALGDYIDVKLVYVEYRIPTDVVDISLYAGKFDSVLGIEYRAQESPDRIGIIPSLICRYTCGRPLGLKARFRFADDLFVLNIAVTNGSSQVEFFPFYDEIDTNVFKSVSARLSTKLPIGSGLEIGASGSFGAQDFQTDNSVYQWHYGFDAHLDIAGFDLRAEFVQGAAEGKDQTGMPEDTCGVTPCLYYKGAYGQFAYRLTNWFIPYLRVEWRNALHRSGESFVYITDEARVGAGLRFDLSSAVIFKAEFIKNLELGVIPTFADDIVTSSLVVKY